MTRLGADISQMHDLSRTMRGEADKILSSISTIKGRLDSTWWEGPDAQRFRSAWDGDHSARLRQVADALMQAAADVSNQAKQQQHVSNS